MYSEWPGREERAMGLEPTTTTLATWRSTTELRPRSRLWPIITDRPERARGREKKSHHACVPRSRRVTSDAERTRNASASGFYSRALLLPAAQIRIIPFWF